MSAQVRRQRPADPLPQSKKGQIHKARRAAAFEIETDTRYHLNSLLTHIAAGDTNDIAIIQRNYSKEVEDILRTAITNAYIAGINYVAQTRQKMHRAYINTADIGIIKKLTAEFVDIFWRRVANVLHQKDVINSILSARFSPKSSLTLGNLVNGFVVRLITRAIALGTLAKVNVLKHTGVTKSAAASADQQSEDDSEDDTPAPPADDGTVETLEWQTQEDERVCPYCDELDGQQWASNDPDLQIPGQDSHDFCRCVLNIVS
jgi:hypothetical protein